MRTVHHTPSALTIPSGPHDDTAHLERWRTWWKHVGLLSILCATTACASAPTTTAHNTKDTIPAQKKPPRQLPLLASQQGVPEGFRRVILPQSVSSVDHYGVCSGFFSDTLIDEMANKNAYRCEFLPVQEEAQTKRSYIVPTEQQPMAYIATITPRVIQWANVNNVIVATSCDKEESVGLHHVKCTTSQWSPADYRTIHPDHHAHVNTLILTSLMLEDVVALKASKWSTLKRVIIKNKHHKDHKHETMLEELMEALSTITTLEDLRINDSGPAHVTSPGVLVKLSAMRTLRVLHVDWIFQDRKKVRDTLSTLTNLESLRFDAYPFLKKGPSVFAKLKALREIAIDANTSMTQQTLNDIAALPHLRVLALPSIKLGVVSASPLGSAPKLGILHLFATGLKDQDLQTFKSAHALRGLTLLNTSLKGDGLEHLAELTSLRQVKLEGMKLKGTKLKHLSGLKQMRRLSLNADMRNEDLAHLQGMKALRSLRLGTQRYSWDKNPAPPKLTGEGLAFLKEMPHLTSLKMTLSAANRIEHMRHLANFPTLTNFYIYGLRWTDESLAYLSGLTKLKTLSVQNSKVTGPGLAQLNDLNDLISINLSYNPLDDKGLAALPQLQSLQQVNIAHTQVSDEGLIRLAKKHPGLKSLHVGHTKTTLKSLTTLAKQGVHVIAPNKVEGITPAQVKELRAHYNVYWEQWRKRERLRREAAQKPASPQ